MTEQITPTVRSHGCMRCNRIFECEDCTAEFQKTGNLFAKSVYRSHAVVEAKHYICEDCKNAEKKIPNR